MISLIALFTILTCHWVFDFVCQTHQQATNKSTSNQALLAHTSTYSVLWLIPAAIADAVTRESTGEWLFAVQHVQLFVGITFVLHTITDYFTSRLNSYLWKKGDVHNFFVSVGFDQLLHYVQLILTYKLLAG